MKGQHLKEIRDPENRMHVLRTHFELCNGYWAYMSSVLEQIMGLVLMFGFRLSIKALQKSRPSS